MKERETNINEWVKTLTNLNTSLSNVKIKENTQQTILKLGTQFSFGHFTFNDVSLPPYPFRRIIGYET